jgi:DNA replication protein DnaC
MVEMTLEQAQLNAQGWRELLTESKQTMAEYPSGTREWNKARRDMVEAKAALEWYEGYYEIPVNVIRSFNERFGGGWSTEDVPREQKIFHPGVIQSLAGKAQRLKESSNLGARFLDRTFTMFDAKQNRTAFDKASKYANSDSLFSDSRNCLLMIGGTGTGKTHLAAAIANVLVDRGIPTRFATFGAHLENIRKEFDVSGQKKYLDEIKGVPMLVLDDIGREKVTDWTRSVLFDIVNYRYEHLLPMILTSNLQGAELANYCGDAVWSRLYEMCDTLEMNGEDYRRR